MAKAKSVSVKKFVLNCDESTGTDTDWTFEDAVATGSIKKKRAFPSRKDLRANWWPINHQRNTGACVGFATAYGVLRWHYVRRRKLPSVDSPANRPSARFIWMANKETDNITSRPTTFLEAAGTQTKLALRVAQKFGCVTDDILPMSGRLTTMNPATFYSRAAQLRILAYFNLRRKLDNWRRWIAFNGPILTRLNVDRTWDDAAQTGGNLDQYQPNTTRGGHAVCLVGYTKSRFIVRNSWGTGWGDGGFAYASNKYAEQAFTEAYGALV